MAANVLVTGASGFVGRRVVQEAENNMYLRPIGAVRVVPNNVASSRYRKVGDFQSWYDWTECLQNIDVVVHCAARVHVMSDSSLNPLASFREVNVEGSLSLARQAAALGVKRFIFLSSIKVNGEGTALGSVYRPDDAPAPTDPYGVSKMEAEFALQILAAETGMELVIIRPPLVYGPGVKGNFASMIKLVGKGLPLPLGAVHNKRSLVALDNLVDLIITCIDHPGAADQTFLASDGEDISTTQLLQGIAQAMGKPSRLIPVPASVLQFAATLLGKKAVAQRLLGSLQVDISHTQKCLNWTPPLTVKQGLQRCFPNQQD
jgi:nucleoside-diphosphate-sugar epimerase